jgi:hypothetical protein
MGKQNQTRKKAKVKKQKQRSNSSKCTSKIDIFTQEKFTKKSNIVKFQPNQSKNVFNCYEKKSLSKYITFQLNKNKHFDEIVDVTTRIPFGLEFMCAHFSNEIFKYIEMNLMDILFDVKYDDYPDGRIFTNVFETFMDFIDDYYPVWIQVDNRRYGIIKKKIQNVITNVLKDNETDFEERAMDEVNEYFFRIDSDREGSKN